MERFERVKQANDVKTGHLSNARTAVVPNRNHFDGLCAFRYLVAVLL